MITIERQIVIANETADFQASNRMPSLESDERFAKNLDFIAKHRDEINSAIEKNIGKAAAIARKCESDRRHLKYSELPILCKACGASIGRIRFEDDVNAIETALTKWFVKPIRTNMFTYRNAQRMRANAMRCIAGFRAELKKQRQDQSENGNKDGEKTGT